MAPEQQLVRIKAFGLDNPQTTSFMDACEFVSLGGYCGAAFCLQALGLKKFSYPFDWVRSPVDGVIRCFGDNFRDFVTYDFFAEENGLHLYGSSRWGGSFWHHDPRSEKVKTEFNRRVDRIMGRRCEVPPQKHRVFVRVANSTREIGSTLRLYEALQRTLPETKIYLVVLVDLQEEAGLVRLQDLQEVLFCKINKQLYANIDAHFADQIRANTDAYAEAVAQALRFWAGHFDTVSPLWTTECVEAFACDCDQYDGGDPAVSLYTPRHVR